MDAWAAWIACCRGELMDAIREHVTELVTYVGKNTGWGLRELYSLTIEDLVEHANAVSDLIERENKA